MNLNQVTLPAKDIRRSIAFYTRMGFTLIVDSPHYARFESIEGEATFSVHEVDQTVNSRGVVFYFESDCLDEKVAELQAEGFVFDKEPTDESWLWREARLKDPDGNTLCLYHAGDNRKYPPWRVADV